MCDRRDTFAFLSIDGADLRSIRQDFRILGAECAKHGVQHTSCRGSGPIPTTMKHYFLSPTVTHVLYTYANDRISEHDKDVAP